MTIRQTQKRKPILVPARRALRARPAGKKERLLDWLLEFHHYHFVLAIQLLQRNNFLLTVIPYMAIQWHSMDIAHDHMPQSCLAILVASPNSWLK